jgi:hypothetical protein
MPLTIPEGPPEITPAEDLHVPSVDQQSKDMLLPAIENVGDWSSNGGVIVQTMIFLPVISR